MERLKVLTIYCNLIWQRLLQRSVRQVRVAGFPKLYLCGAALALLLTTVFWSVLGAHVQLHNADQLSDPYMFSNGATFRGAAFPSAHTFLLKWPIFWLVGRVGISTGSLTVATVAVTLATVGSLMLVLYKIERRPLALGTLYLALGLVLLLVPAQPYAGGLLPVNMAMLTTRNIEYAVYLGALVLLIKSRRFRDWAFVGGVALLGILIASDKLFLGLSLGGAGLALVVYALVNNWKMVTFATRWLAGSVLAYMLGTAAVAVIAGLHFTHIGGSGISPYGTGGGAKDLVLGVCYAVLGLLTNLGANPAYSNKVIGTLPHELFTQLISLEGVLHLALAVACLGALLLMGRFICGSVRKQAVGKSAAPLPANQLAAALICSTLVAAGLFIVTKHYYAVDARYLTIGLFAVAVTVATVLRGYRLQPQWFVYAGGVLAVLTLFALVAAQHTAAYQAAAYSEIDDRNAAVIQALKRRSFDTLVGDYWRVLPIKLATHGSLIAMPLASCTTPSAALTSTAWQPDLSHQRFAYLITLSGSLTNYPNCGLPQITTAYGRPNSIQVIAGTLANPKEALLFYETGSHPSPTPTAAQVPPAPLLPIHADQLTKTDCAQATIMNFVAHEDDDLLFMNPDLLHELHDSDCVRTVFMTAGDSGFNKFYWLSRQLGAEEAYSTMLGVANVWDQQTLAVSAGEYITIATPRDSSQVSLIFMNLPDGGLKGDGFPDSGNESLQKLYQGNLPAIHAVDGQSSYSTTQLVDALATLMNIYQPAEIHTQADVPSDQYPDHSDHIATGQLTVLASSQYDQQHFGDAVSIPVKRYIGYPVHSYAPNVAGDDLAQKEAAFLAYAEHDGGVCHSIAQCAGTATYAAYLSHQYQEDPAQP